MHLKNITLLILAFTIFYSCNEKYHPELLKLKKPPSDVEFVNRYTLKKIDNFINLELPKGIPNVIGLVDYLEDDSLFFFKYAQNKIAKIDLSKSTIDSIILPEETITGTIKNINIINNDSMLFVQDNPQSLILIKPGSGGKIIPLPKINFTHENDEFELLSNSYTETEGNYILDYSDTHYDAKTQRVHIGMQPFLAHNNEGFEESERIATFNLATKEWENLYAPPEGILKYKENATFTYLLSQKRIHFKNDTVFINYLNDHFIYYYKGGNYLGKFAHISKHAKDIFLPVHLNYLDDIENRKKYTYSAPKYGNFYYHKKLKLYSRLYFDQQEPIDSNGMYKHHELSRDVYVVFLDEKFKYVGEYKFPNGSISSNSFKPLPDGFLAYDLKEGNLSTSEFGLKDKYEIVQIKDHNDAE